MIPEVAFHLALMLIPLFHSKFARLPVMVVLNILVFTAVIEFVDNSFDTSISPGIEMFYTASAVYFLTVAVLFGRIKDNLYRIVSMVMLVYAASSAMMLVWDGFWIYDEFINENVIAIQTVIVFLSAMRLSCRQK